MKCEKCGHDDIKIKLLQIEIKELNKKIQEAKSEFEISSRFMDIAKDMDKGLKQNLEVYEKISKEHLAKELEALRLNVEKIRKISPDSADILNEIINEYEKSHRMLKEITDKVGDVKTTDLAVWMFLAFLASFAGIAQKIHEMVEACSLAIRDTAKRLE